MNVRGYLFSDEQDDGAVEAHMREMEHFTAGLGGRLSLYYVETDSSLKMPFRERAEGKKLLADLQSGDVIVTAKAEWVLSSAKEGLGLISSLAENAISLYCVDLGENITLPSPRQLVVSEGNAQLIRKLLESLAVSESTTHGQSIKAAKRRMKKEGKYLGGPVPFGWCVQGEYLVKDKEQQKIIREIRKLKADRWSYRDIAKKLNERFDIHLSHEGVRKVLIKHTGG